MGIGEALYGVGVGVMLGIGVGWTASPRSAPEPACVPVPWSVPDPVMSPAGVVGVMPGVEPGVPPRSVPDPVCVPVPSSAPVAVVLSPLLVVCAGARLQSPSVSAMVVAIVVIFITPGDRRHPRHCISGATPSEVQDAL